jgi:UDP-N-acetylglucosamine diphosphorylase / glucose-1-phosphate thymidylyltransferase / UDP-N-acetylgalactosamine diphosphorylase / glucosamine-1-phosphate N-acetyltransferase / galactosamine-1-phosphate N-acetyltransferase
MTSQIQTIGIIFAAGRGSRLSPLTDKTPKPLMKIQNKKTLLEINLERTAPLVDEFLIVVSWLGDQIKVQIGNEFLGKKVTFVEQKNPAGGTLDALKTAIFSYKKRNQNHQKNFLISNSDNICGQQFYDILALNIQENAEKSYLMAKKVLDLEILKASGVFVVDKDLELKEVIEKSTEFVSDLLNIGIYYFPSKILEFLSENKFNLSQKEELITDLFNDYKKKYPIKIISVEDNFFGVSNQSDLEKLQQNFSY